MKHDAISQICHIALDGFARAAAAARPGSPMDQARTKLGDRFCQVACDALKATVLRVLTDPEMKELVTQASPGLPVGEMWMATIIADTSAAIIAVADQEAA
ncbi:MAG: hypothetical protein FJ109_09955 [Deltaproteobacteria bacterium]|nr:hypothetical protein [Deltaproteobacteria bacterium]